MTNSVYTIVNLFSTLSGGYGMEHTHGFRTLIDHLARVQKAGDSVPRNYGIDTPLKTNEIHLLDLIDKNPDANLTELSEMLWTSKMAVSALARKLEEKKVLNVVPGNNKKELKCTLTERGKIAVATHDAFHRMEDVYLSERMASYSEEEIDLVIKVLKDYALYLEEYAEDSTIL